MRVLVTGASGFAGGHLLRELLRQDVHVFAASQQGGGTAPADRAQGPGRLDWLELDITRTASVEAVVRASRPERVYHLAGQSSVGQSFQDPALTWEVNATGTVRLVDALRREVPSPPRFLLVSSAEVYGAVPEEAQPIGEESPIRPITPYGASKAAAELASMQAHAAGWVDAVVVRSFNHAGPGQDERFLFPSMARQLVRMRHSGGGGMLAVGNLEPKRDFLDVRDVVRAYVTLMERGRGGEVYNVCSGLARPLSEVVALLVELSGADARIEVDPARVRPVDIPVLAGNPERVQATGWQPEYPLSQTLQDLLAAEHTRAAEEAGGHDG